MSTTMTARQKAGHRLARGKAEKRQREFDALDGGTQQALINHAHGLAFQMDADRVDEARAATRDARLRLGEYALVESFGTSEAGCGALRPVPEGWVGVLLRSEHGDERYRLAYKPDFDRVSASGEYAFQWDFEALAPWHADEAAFS